MLVLYRACSTGNPNKVRPVQGKLELVTLCFNSLIETLKNHKYDLVVLLDKPNTAFRELFEGYAVEESYYGDFTEGNINSFHRQMDIALEWGDDFIFVEDDYYFLPNAGKKMHDALNRLDGFFTPYDHPGYYTEPIHAYDKEMVEYKGQEWQRVISTTLTFGGKIDALKREHEVMRTYGWADHPMWVDVTRRIPLYAPVPTLATHMETPHLAPEVDWGKYF